jgi:hypothetical protein
MQKRLKFSRKMVKETVVALGLTAGLGSATVLLITFLTAYTHNKTTLITINTYHEANFELILFPLVVILIVLSCCIYFNDKSIKRDD